MPALVPDRIRDLTLPPFDPLNRRAAALRAEGHRVISLGQAVPFFGPPESALQAARAAIGTPEVNRYEYTYMQIEKDFLVNIQNSKKVMSLSLAIMTHYDERVFENVKKHDFALRSTILDILRQVPESEVNKPEFRLELARKIRDAMNTQLEKYEDFGGIEEVFYTNFVIQ